MRSKWLQRKYSGVTAFIGMPGSGKTYGLVQVAKRDLDAGRTVYVNEGFDVRGCQKYRSYEELLLVPPGSTILLDEAPTYFNARRWQEFPDGMLYRLTQIRKDGLRFYYSAIHEDMVDVTLRRLTFWFWQCRAVTGRLLMRALYPPELFRKADQRPSRRELVWVRDDVAGLYDTEGKVSISLKQLKRLREVSGETWIRLEADMSLDELFALAESAESPRRVRALPDARRGRNRADRPGIGADGPPASEAADVKEGTRRREGSPRRRRGEGPGGGGDALTREPAVETGRGDGP